MRREQIKLTRSGLYEEVWTRPVQEVAAKYGISGTALKKICVKLGVPTPPVGFWARKTAGQKVTRVALGPPRRNAPEHHILVPQTCGSDAASFAPEMQVAIGRERTPSARLEVFQELTAPHPLVASAAPLLRRAGLGARRDVLLLKPCLDVVVSRERLDRALWVVDALIKGLEQRGLSVEVTEPMTPGQYRGGAHWLGRQQEGVPSRTGVRVGDAFVAFTLEERLDVVWPYGKPPASDDFKAWFEWKRTHSGRPDYEHKPSGQLGLRITSSVFGQRQAWRDGKVQRLESLLNDFIAGVLEAAERDRLWAEQRAREEREREQARLRAELEAARRELERRKRADLRRRSASWARARRVDELVDAFETKHGLAQHEEWVAWARREADRLRALALAAPE